MQMSINTAFDFCLTSLFFPAATPGYTRSPQRTFNEKKTFGIGGTWFLQAFMSSNNSEGR